MGNSGWDDTWRRGRSLRDGRSADADRSHSHVARGSSSSWERGRGHDHAGSSGRGSQGDDGRSGSGSRRGGYEGSSNRSRDEYANGRPGDRSMRSPRPPGPGRDDAYGPPRHHHRPPDRGGVWADDGARPRRPGAGGPPGMRGMRPDPRDPRLAARRPMGGAAAEDDEDDESSFTFGKAVLAILMMFALGAVAGFGYFRLSAPTVHTNSNNNQQQSTPSTAPATTPSASPSTTPSATATPHADIRPASGPTALVPAGYGQAYVIVVRSEV